MLRDFTVLLWLLKLGAVVNLYFLAGSFALPASAADAHILVPARILFAVSAFRCLFPVIYKGNVVFHDTALSSIFLTRLLATFVEVAYIYQLSLVIRLLNVERVGWVNAVSWLMVVQVVVSQFFVWAAILTGRLAFYFYEELGWAFIFLINTIASAWLFVTIDSFAGAEILIRLNLVFGLVYLPFQLVHLRVLRSDATQSRETIAGQQVSWEPVKEGLNRSLHARNRKVDAKSWGGPVGVIWMTAYWATLIPIWVNQVVAVFSR